MANQPTPNVTEVVVSESVRVGLILAIDALITWYDDHTAGHDPSHPRLRRIIGLLYQAGPHPDPGAAADINLLVSYGPRLLNTQALLAMERLRLLNQSDVRVNDRYENKTSRQPPAGSGGANAQKRF